VSPGSYRVFSITSGVFPNISGLFPYLSGIFPETFRVYPRGLGIQAEMSMVLPEIPEVYIVCVVNHSDR
jgi:hypothetical protein